MKWKKVTIRTSVEAEDLISLMLSELGVEGVEIEDNVPLSETDIQSMFIDILPEESENDGTSKISFYLHEEEPNSTGTNSTGPIAAKPGMNDDGTADNSYAINDRIWNEREIGELMEKIRTGLEEMREYCDIGEGTIEIGESSDTDWRDKWKEFFQPILIGSILILPSWLEAPEEYREDIKAGRIHIVRIDPGVAFGTGNHETTRLCIPELIKAVKPGSRVLDLGSGSGILAVAANRLGASLVTAVDIDPACSQVLKENAEKNGINAKEFPIIIGNVLSEDGTASKILKASGGNLYDVAVANILAPVIIHLAKPGAADRFLRSGGTFITSGILKSKENEVLEAFAANPEWEQTKVHSDGEWVEITAKKR